MSCHCFSKLSLLFCLLSMLTLVHVPETSCASYLWNYCPTDSNYTTNSTIQTNLNLLLASLNTSAAATGYYNDTKGLPPDQMHGLALCRGDVSSTECQSCLSQAIQEIVQRCPNGKRSTMFYENCLLGYSNKSFFSAVDTSFTYYAFNTANVSDKQTFDSLLGSLMDSLTTTASSSSKLFAAGFVNYTDFSKIYGLVQCTRDLSEDNCYACLQNKVGGIPTCCDGKEGGKVYGQSCFIRFELYPFYNISAVDVSTPPPPLRVSSASPPPVTEPATNSSSPSQAANRGPPFFR